MFLIYEVIKWDDTIVFACKKANKLWNIDKYAIFTMILEMYMIMIFVVAGYEETQSNSAIIWSTWYCLRKRFGCDSKLWKKGYYGIDKKTKLGYLY